MKRFIIFLIIGLLLSVSLAFLVSKAHPINKDCDKQYIFDNVFSLKRSLSESERMEITEQILKENLCDGHS